MKRKHGHVMA